MKKPILIFVICILAFTLKTQAQAPYQNGIGLTVDVGTGATGAGIGFKHFFSVNNVAEINLLFYDNITSLAAFYEYYGPIQNAPGLNWYIGLGPQFLFAKQTTSIAVRLPIGLDYKIPTVPLDFSFDWRPFMRLNHGTEFLAARFAFGIRFAF